MKHKSLRIVCLVSSAYYKKRRGQVLIAFLILVLFAFLQVHQSILQLLSCCADLNHIKFSKVIELLEKKMKSMTAKLRELRVRLDELTREGSTAGEDGFLVLFHMCIGKKAGSLNLALSFMVTCPCLGACVCVNVRAWLILCLQASLIWVQQRRTSRTLSCLLPPPHRQAHPLMRQSMSAY